MAVLEISMPSVKTSPFATPLNRPLLTAVQDAVPVGSPVPPAPVPPSGAETAPSLDSWRELEEGYRLSVLKGLMQCRQKRREAVAQYFAIQTQLLDTLYGEHMSVDGVPEVRRRSVDIWRPFSQLYRQKP